MKEPLNYLQTEQTDERYTKLDRMSTSELLSLMNEADRTVPEAVGRVLPHIDRAVELITSRLVEGGRLVYIGAGTSGRIGLLDAAECPPTFGVTAEQVQALLAGGEQALSHAFEDAEDRTDAAREDLQHILLTDRDVVVGIAASGRTPYVIGGLTYARQLGSATVALSCNLAAPISALADVAIEVDTGPEVLMGSTRLKAGTAQKLVLNMLSTACMIRLGKTYRNLMVDLLVTNEKLAERARRMVVLATNLDDVTAEQWLSAANGHVKLAILMARTGLALADAEQRLAAVGGILRLALAEAD